MKSIVSLQNKYQTDEMMKKLGVKLALLADCWQVACQLDLDQVWHLWHRFYDGVSQLARLVYVMLANAWTTSGKPHLSLFQNHHYLLYWGCLLMHCMGQTWARQILL